MDTCIERERDGADTVRGYGQSGVHSSHQTLQPVHQQQTETVERLRQLLHVSARCWKDAAAPAAGVSCCLSEPPWLLRLPCACLGRRGDVRKGKSLCVGQHTPRYFRLVVGNDAAATDSWQIRALTIQRCIGPHSASMYIHFRRVGGRYMREPWLHLPWDRMFVRGIGKEWKWRGAAMVTCCDV
jgi:hypothetical protein